MLPRPDLLPEEGRWVTSQTFNTRPMLFLSTTKTLKDGRNPLGWGLLSNCLLSMIVEIDVLICQICFQYFKGHKSIQVYRIAIWGYSLLSVSFHITGIRNASFKQTFRYLDDKTVSNANLVLGINCAHGHRSVKVQGGEEAEVWGNTTLVFQQIKVFTVFSAILI